MAASVDQIVERLNRYLNGGISLHEFEDWFVPATWDNHRAKEEQADSLAEDIELFLSEYRDGILNRSEFRKELANAICAFSLSGVGDGSDSPCWLDIPARSSAAILPMRLVRHRASSANYVAATVSQLLQVPILRSDAV